MGWQVKLLPLNQTRINYSEHRTLKLGRDKHLPVCVKHEAPVLAVFIRTEFCYELYKVPFQCL